MSVSSQLGRAALLTALLTSILFASSLLAADSPLGPHLISQPSVIGMQVSPDSRRVVFVRTPDLYSAPAAGGPAVRLNQQLAKTESGVTVPISPDSWGVKISPDSSRVVYRARQLDDSEPQLYSVPITGGTPVRLSSPASDEVYASTFVISPDSRRVVYSTDEYVSHGAHGELFSVPIAGGPSIKLYGAQTWTEQAWNVQISPDSSRVVYEQIGDAYYRQDVSLWSIPITGGSGVMLSPPGSIVENCSRITPDGSRVVYSRESASGDSWQLWSQPIAGGAATPIAQPAATNTYDFEISSDSSRAVFFPVGDAHKRELYSARVDGTGTAVRLSQPLPDGGTIDSFKLSNNGSRVVYILAPGSGQFEELHSVSIAGDAARLLASGLSIKAFEISPDSSRVAYIGRFEQDGLYSVPLAGGEPRLIDKTAESEELPTDLTFTPDSRVLLYRREGAAADRSGLFQAPADGSAVPRKLSGSLPSVYGRFRSSPDSRFVVFMDGAGSDQPHALYRSDLVPRFGSYLPLAGR